MARKARTEESGFDLFSLLEQIEVEAKAETLPEPQPRSIRSAQAATTPPTAPARAVDQLSEVRSLIQDSDIVGAAQLLATLAHADVYRRDGSPYITHPAAVADRLIDLDYGDSVVAVAWLHDVVEDTDLTLADLADLGFTRDVVAGVDSVTRRPGELYFDLVKRSAADPIGKVVKSVDNEDNGRGDEPGTPGNYRDQISRERKYLKARTILAEAMYEAPSATPDLTPQPARSVLDPVPHPTADQIRQIKDRAKQQAAQRSAAAPVITVREIPVEDPGEAVPGFESLFDSVDLPEQVAEPANAPTVEPPAQTPEVFAAAADYVPDPAATAPKTPKARAAANIAAIRVLDSLDTQRRPATPADQAVLAGWTGWGAAPLIFNAPKNKIENWWQQVFDRQIPGTARTAAAALAATNPDGGWSWTTDLSAGLDTLRAATTAQQAVVIGRDLAATIKQHAPQGDPDATAAFKVLNSALSGVIAAADWQDLQTELSDLLTPDQWNAARQSTVNAHYTDPMIVAQMWDTITALGGPGPVVLEPGCGSGTFIGQAPPGTQMIGVELDPLTAKVAANLYPSATIYNEGFQSSGWQTESVTAVIGNVPFGDFKLFDPEYNAAGHSIHNHFINKSLALTAPGGLVALLTSSHTMDATGATARREMHTYGDLLGAVRLPNGAFRDVAGTDVVCDILIFRRRMDDESPLPLSNWEAAIGITTINGDTSINTYFVHHPERVLGELQLGSGQHGRTELKVIANKETTLQSQVREQLQAIVAAAGNLGTEYSVNPATELAPVRSEINGAWDATARPGTIRIAGVGFEQLHPRTRTWQPFTIKATKPLQRAANAEARMLLTMRTAAETLIGLQTSGTDAEQIPPARQALAGMYEHYVRAYGPINRFKSVEKQSWILQDNLDESEIDPEWPTRERPGKVKASDPDGTVPDPVIQVQRTLMTHVRPPAVVALRSDPGFAAVLALEVFDDEMMTSKPAKILTEDVLTIKDAPTTAESPAEALSISMAETGRVDLYRIAELLPDGTSPAIARQLLGELVFDDPATDQLIPATLYLAGDTRAKLDLARHAANGDDRFLPNIAALQAVVPTDLTPGDIDARPGVTWIAGADYEAFIRQVLDIPSVTVTRQHYLGQWEVSKPAGGVYSVAATRTWGNDNADGLTILKSLMNNSPLTIMRTVYDADGNSRETPDAEATEVINDKRDQLAQRFNTWLWEDEERGERLLNTYNRTFNSYVAATYDGSGLTFPGLGSHFDPRPTQTNAVARILTDPTVLLDHVVGAGKTGTMIMAAMELRRTGQATQPWIVVPNHIATQVAREAKQWYPGAQILAGASATDATYRREFAALSATGDYDIVIVPESLFTLLPVSDATQSEYIQSRLENLESALLEQKAGTGGEATVKQLEKAKTRLEEKLISLRDSGKAGTDTGIQFEQTGCDYLFIDEAHHYKNRMVISGTADLARPVEPQRATDLDMKLRHLRSTKPDQPHCTFATGTPIANSPREMWVMMDYLIPQTLEKAGLEAFDAWAGNHLRPQTRLEMKPTGAGFAPKTRVTQFTNVPDLTRMWRQVADLVTRDDLGVELPQLKTGTRIINTNPRTPEQAAYSLELEARAAQAKGRRPQKGEDNHLKIASDGKKAALDQRLAGLPAPEDGGRPAHLAAEILRIERETQHRTYVDENKQPQGRPGALQLVFCDQSTPKPNQWNMYGAIKKELIDGGMRPEQIAYIHDARNDVERADIFTRARDGRISVLIGSTHKMGTGANIQNRCAALHHVDPPWRPADLEQREGRIRRQGNQNVGYGPVEMLAYVTEGTFDAFSWDTVARKQGTISQVKNGSLSRHIDADDADTMSYDEIAAVSSGNPYIKERFDVQAQVVRLGRLETAHYQEQRDNRHALTRAEAGLITLNEDLTRLIQMEKRRPGSSGDNFRITIGTNTYTDRVEAGKALTDVIGNLIPRTGAIPSMEREIGSMSGLTLRAEAFRGDKVIQLRFPALRLDGLQRNGTATTTDLAAMYDAEKPGLGLIRRLENYLDAIPESIERLNTRIGATPGIIDQLRVNAEGTFAHAQELQERTARLKWLNKELADADKPVQARVETPPQWLTDYPDAENMVWGNALHRLVPDGATTAADLREGDILAPTNKTKYLAVIGRVYGSSMMDIRTHPIGSDVLSDQSRRRDTTMGIVGRHRHRLTALEAILLDSPPQDQFAPTINLQDGDQISLDAWAADISTVNTWRDPTAVISGTIIGEIEDSAQRNGIRLLRITLDIGGAPTVIHAAADGTSIRKAKPTPPPPPAFIPAPQVTPTAPAPEQINEPAVKPDEVETTMTQPETTPSTDLDQDQYITINDPDHPMDMPIYEGIASETHRYLQPGTYTAETDNGPVAIQVTATASSLNAPSPPQPTVNPVIDVQPPAPPPAPAPDTAASPASNNDFTALIDSIMQSENQSAQEAFRTANAVMESVPHENRTELHQNANTFFNSNSGSNPPLPSLYAAYESAAEGIRYDLEPRAEGELYGGQIGQFIDLATNQLLSQGFTPEWAVASHAADFAIQANDPDLTKILTDAPNGSESNHYTDAINTVSATFSEFRFLARILADQGDLTPMESERAAAYVMDLPAGTEKDLIETQFAGMDVEALLASALSTSATEPAPEQVVHDFLNLQIPERVRAVDESVKARAAAFEPTASPQATPSMAHGANGTIVTGTNRDNVTMRAALKDHGFKWSSKQNFWYLPRTWRETTRDQTVKALRSELAGKGVSLPLTGNPPATNSPAQSPLATAASKGIGWNNGPANAAVRAL